MKDFMSRLATMNPALLRGLVVALVWFLASIGIVLSPNAPDASIGVLAAILAIVQALWTRPAVTPNAKVAVYVPDPINSPEIVAAGQAVTTATSTDIVSAARSAGDDNDTTGSN